MKQCPFCGSRNIDIDAWMGGPVKRSEWMYAAVCSDCKARGPEARESVDGTDYVNSPLRDDAAQAWNERPTNG